MSIHQDKIIESTLKSVSVGDKVCAADGEEIGKVAEVTNDAIKVDEPLHGAYWIAGDYVVRAADGSVDLSFVRKDIGVYRMNASRPRDADPLVGQQSDTIVGEDEQLDTRLRMERELAEQRRALPHTHISGSGNAPDTFGTIGEPVESELARHGAAPEPHLRGPEVRDEATPETQPTGGIANMAGLWLTGLALLGAVGAATAWRRSRRSTASR